MLRSCFTSRTPPTLSRVFLCRRWDTKLFESFPKSFLLHFWANGSVKWLSLSRSSQALSKTFGGHCAWQRYSWESPRHLSWAALGTNGYLLRKVLMLDTLWMTECHDFTTVWSRQVYVLWVKFQWKTTCSWFCWFNFRNCNTQLSNCM